jgi:hypothetical protein
VVVFSRKLRPSILPDDLAARALQGVVERLEAVGNRTPDNPDVLLLPGEEADLHTYARWLQELIRERDDASDLLVGIQQRVPISIRTEHQLRQLEDGSFDVDGLACSASEVYARFRVSGVFEDQRPPRGPIPETLCDLGLLRLPKDPTTAGDAAIRLMGAQPQLAGIMGDALHKLGDALTTEQLAALAGTSPSLLMQVAGRWPSALAGRSTLVELAMQIGSPVRRAGVLLALGAPAREALARTTDEIIALLPGQGSSVALADIADRSALLNLSFWEKRLHRPWAFEALRRSKRLQACWRLRPSGLVRALEKLTQQNATEPALEVLSWLYRNARHVLPEQSPTVIRLLEQAVPDHWNIAEELMVLAHLDTPETRTRIAAIIGTREIDTDTAVRAGVQHDTLWTALHEKELVNPYLVVAHLYSGSATQIQVTKAAARAVIIHVINRGLLDLADAATADPGVLAEAVYWHRTEGEARLMAKHLPGFESIVFEDDDRSPPGMPDEQGSPEWLDALLDCDRAALLEEIGALCARRYREQPWRRHIPALLGGALRARCRDRLGTHGDAILDHLGERWPTRSRLESAATALDLALDQKALDRCADEGLPALFRAVVSDLHRPPSTKDELYWSAAEDCATWIMGDAWAEDPALVSRHLVGELRADRPTPWVHGVALALVALREPVGTTIPDALTRLAHELPDSKVFLLKQRDTFARSSAARERDKPAQYRTKQALVRLGLAAQRASRLG